MDDFGTGYSSISHLRDLPIAGLKLDRSFTCAMRAKDTKSLRLAQALVGVAEGLELDTVAEGGRNHGGGPPARLPGLAARSGLALRQGGPPCNWIRPRFRFEAVQPGATWSAAQQAAKAAAGSVAPLIGRPITSWLAPAATAAAGVITRF